MSSLCEWRTSGERRRACNLTNETASYGLIDFLVAHSGGTAIVTYKTTVYATCWEQKAPSPLYVMTVYNQHGDSWLPVAHSATPAAHS